MTGEFPAQGYSNADNVSIWWRHHGFAISLTVNTTDNDGASVSGDAAAAAAVTAATRAEVWVWK